MKKILYVLFLVAISCCKTTKKPDPGYAISPLVEQVSQGKCSISFSPDVLGVDGSIVELTVDSIYYGIFLISYNDFIVVPCSTGDRVTFRISKADGTFLRQKIEAVSTTPI